MLENICFICDWLCKTKFHFFQLKFKYGFISFNKHANLVKICTKVMIRLVDEFSLKEKSPWPSNIKSFVLVLKRRGRFLCSFNAVTCFLFLQKKLAIIREKELYFKSSSLARRLLMSLPQGRKKVCTLLSFSEP